MFIVTLSIVICLLIFLNAVGIVYNFYRYYQLAKLLKAMEEYEKCFYVTLNNERKEDGQ